MKPQETTACNATTTDELYDFLSKKQDTTLLDLEWMDKGMNFIDDGGTYDIEKNWSNPHDMKPDLREQWGKGNENILYTEDVNIPQSIAKKASKDELFGAFIVKTATAMMNAGKKKEDIFSAIASKMDISDAQKYASKIASSLENYGSTGRFVVEASGYKSCRDAMADASKSKFKKYFAYIRNCSCKDRIVVNNDRYASGDGTFNSLFTSENVKTASSSYQVCPCTGLRIMAGASDIDAKWAGDTAFDMMNACASNEEDGVKKIASVISKPYEGLVALCCELDKAPELDQNEFSTGNEEAQDINLSKTPVEIVMDKAPAPLLDGVDMSGKAMGDCGCDMGFALDETGAPLEGDVAFDVSQNDDYFSGCNGKNFDLDIAPQQEAVGFSSVNLPCESNCDSTEAQKIMDISMGTYSNTQKDEDYFTTPSRGVIQLEKKLDSPVVEFGLSASSLSQPI
jgi:hypothetical protein